MKPATTPMKRTAFARSERIEAREVSKLKRTAPKRKVGLRAKGQRSTPIRRAARGQDCTLRLAVCNFDPDTTVLCHSNFLADGKGLGLKAPDTAAAFGCSACHDVLDGRRPRPADLSLECLQAAFRLAVGRTHEILRSMGLLAAAANNQKQNMEHT
ncbi:hypothetical protein JAB1_14350 [Janthinobacterium sp. MP5059B]|nr:hypothetical protein JAB1_14350 [Janthinobacterium sp. MP5059B]